MFKIGDKIVYPMHGAGTIEDIEIKEILGEKSEYFIMRMPIGDMKVMVPVNKVEEVGVREIIEKEDLDKVISILEGRMSSMPQNWNRRYRINMDKIKSGDIFEISAVVRNLLILDKEKGLSTGEKKMLGSAKQMLLSEMILVSDKSIDEIEDIILKSIDYSEVLEMEESEE